MEWAKINKEKLEVLGTGPMQRLKGSISSSLTLSSREGAFPLPHLLTARSDVPQTQCLSAGAPSKHYEENKEIPEPVLCEKQMTDRPLQRIRWLFLAF